MSNALIIVVGVVSNILSVVGVVICNKYITEVDGFHFVVFLSFLHFSFTTVFTRIMLAVNIFSYQSAPLDGILPVAAGSLLSVAFMNLNLQHNSVGFYQVGMIACMPISYSCCSHLCNSSVFVSSTYSSPNWHAFHSSCSCSMWLTSSPSIDSCRSHWSPSYSAWAMPPCMTSAWI